MLHRRGVSALGKFALDSVRPNNNGILEVNGFIPSFILIVAS